MSDVVLRSVSDNSIGAMWGRMIFFTVVASSVIHTLAAAATCWSLYLKRPRLVFLVLLIQFAIGALYGFVGACMTEFAIAITLYTINRSELGNTEMAVYISIMIAFLTYCALGRTPTLYGL